MPPSGRPRMPLCTSALRATTKEVLGGFAVVDVAEDEDEDAKLWAAARLVEACGWPHEVRRFKS